MFLSFYLYYFEILASMNKIIHRDPVVVKICIDPRVVARIFKGSNRLMLEKNYLTGFESQSDKL